MEVSEERNQQNGFRMMSPRLDDESEIRTEEGKLGVCVICAQLLWCVFSHEERKIIKTVRGFFIFLKSSAVTCNNLTSGH